MNLNLPLLQELCETPGAPGHEESIRRVVRRELEPLCDEISVDRIGNLVAVKKGREGGRFMMAGHMDEIGFMVSHIHEKGFLHIVPLGGFDPKTLTAQRVVVHGREDLVGVMGSKPIHIMTPEEKKKPLEVTDYYIDLGLPVDEVRQKVRVGDVVTRQRSVIQMGRLLNGKSFDDRIGLFLLIEALRAADEPAMDIYAVASVQEEVGVRGATVAARNIEPHVGVAMDVTLANDVPFARDHETITRLGEGTAIKVFDSSVIANWKLVDFMRETCEERGISYQLEVLPKGGTDSSAIQRAGGGAATSCISVPTRYVHSVIETIHPDDVQASVDLLAALLETCTQDAFALD